jgi:hypothetical protein
MTMIWLDRPEPPMDGDEAASLLGSLERMRLTFWWKCSGLTPEGARLHLGSSGLSLGGLLRHLALVEENTFSHKLWGRPLRDPWASVDWDADPEFEFRTGDELPPDQLVAEYEEAVLAARADVEAALAEGGLAFPARFSWPDGSTPTLRRLLLDQIEEYGRHTGHADLLREAVDGRVGEDAPWPPDAPTRLWSAG